MCGIVGYIGRKDAVPLLLEGLRRLEYRGYDSAGLCTLHGRALNVRKCVGRVARLAELLEQKPVIGSLGISHTRWATHGLPSDANAHPHRDGSGKLALVHNGIIYLTNTMNIVQALDVGVATSPKALVRPGRAMRLFDPSARLCTIRMTTSAERLNFRAWPRRPRGTIPRVSRLVIPGRLAITS